MVSALEGGGVLSHSKKKAKKNFYKSVANFCFSGSKEVKLCV